MNGIDDIRGKGDALEALVGEQASQGENTGIGGDNQRDEAQGNAQAVEQAIENNPQEAQEVLKENSPLMKEAKQVGDGDRRTDEVSDEAVEEAMKDGLTDDFKSVDDLASFLDDNYPSVRSEDEIGSFLLGGYPRVSDEADWKNNPDYVPEEDPHKGEGAPGVLIHKDDDFAGPDELPMQYERYGDLDNSRQLPALSSSREVGGMRLPEYEEEEQPIEYSIEETREPLEEEYDPDYKISFTPPHLDNSRSGGVSDTAGSVSSSPQKEMRQSASFQAPGKAAIGNIGGGSLSVAAIRSAEKEKYVSPMGSSASMAPDYDGQAQADNPEAVSIANNSLKQAGQSSAFGNIGLLGKGGSISASHARLPSGESRGSTVVLQSPEGKKNSGTDMNILALKDKIMKQSEGWPDHQMKEAGITISVQGDRVTINDTLIENADPELINKAREII